MTVSLDAADDGQPSFTSTATAATWSLAYPVNSHADTSRTLALWGPTEEVRMAHRPSATSAGGLLQLLRDTGGMTRHDLLDNTGMSRTTLYERLDRLVRAGLIREAGQEQSTGGRPAKIVSFDDRDKVVLTVDMGHTRCLVGVTALDGTSLAERLLHRGTEDVGALIDRVARTGHDLLTSLPWYRLLGVGLAIPAPVEQGTGTRRSTHALPDADYPMDLELERRFGVPVCVENDARAAALGEYDALLGENRAEPRDQRGGDVLLGIKYSSGIAMGIVTNGSVLTGSTGSAGQIGHIRLDAQGPDCHCGGRGCLTEFVSGRALVRDLGRDDIRAVDDLVRAVDAGDPLVVEAVRRAAHLLGRSLGAVVQASDPAVVVFGGRLGRHPMVAALLAEQARAYSSVAVHRHTEFRPAQLGHRSGSRGLVAIVSAAVLHPGRIDALLEESDPPDALGMPVGAVCGERPNA